jgi:hypothetical protein
MKISTFLAYAFGAFVIICGWYGGWVTGLILTFIVVCAWEQMPK